MRQLQRAFHVKNDQVRRFNYTVISVILKMSKDDSNKCFKHFSTVQKVIQPTYKISIKKTPFGLLYNTKMKQKKAIYIIDLLNRFS